MEVDLSIIIVNYNVKEFLENALNSIKKATVGINAEIFVVDNANLKPSTYAVPSPSFPGL